MPSTTFIQQRRWIISLILRVAALTLNLIGIIILASARIAAIQTIIFAIVAIWSLVELILLCRKRTNHPFINIAFDVCSVVVLVLFGISVIGIIPADGGNTTRALSFIGAVLVFCAAIFHFALFVRAGLHLRAKRREEKKVGWERELGDRN